MPDHPEHRQVVLFPKRSFSGWGGGEGGGQAGQEDRREERTGPTGGVRVTSIRESSRVSLSN